MTAQVGRVREMPRVILASQSPRRTELLRVIGLAHEVRPADIDESHFPDEEPVAHAERLAREKGAKLSQLFPDAVIISADTIVVIDDEILGKPATIDDARGTLRRLGGRTHRVHTAIAVARRGDVRSAVESVDVSFLPLTDADIDGYIHTGEPMDKAGAYGIQGHGAVLVERIVGDYFAVMGLPLSRLVRLLRDIGVDHRFG
ncbi:MAG: Maf family protein, partial [Gemmatimonadaceae bacterium]